MKILRTGAIYRLNYTAWKTTPQPIVFILYAGPQGNKVHCLYLNSSTNSKSEFVRFIALVKQLGNSQSPFLKNSRALYRIFKSYCPNFIRTSYRTLFKNKVSNVAVVSYGLANESDFSEQEKITNDYLLYTQGKRMQQTRIVDAIIPNKKVSEFFYKPNKKPVQQEQKIEIKSNTVKENIQKKPEKNEIEIKQNDPTQRKTSMYYKPNAADELEGYND